MNASSRLRASSIRSDPPGLLARATIRHSGQTTRPSLQRLSYGLVLAGLLALAGCGGNGGSGLSTSDAEHQLTRMVQQTADEKVKGVKVYVGNARCVDDGDSRWQCVVELDPENAEPVEQSGELVCDAERCAWTPEGLSAG